MQDLFRQSDQSAGKSAHSKDALYTQHLDLSPDFHKERASQPAFELLHTGECEIVDGKFTGSAAQMCACVAAEAETGEMLVSSTVKDLVAGPGINFEDRGLRMLPGCGEWRLFRVRK